MEIHKQVLVSDGVRLRSEHMKKKTLQLEVWCDVMKRKSRKRWYIWPLDYYGKSLLK